jgi:cytochrome c biogenesis protein CcmG/thiol:disulfide interchange protein DsbE
MQETDASPDAPAGRRSPRAWLAAALVAGLVLALLGYGLAAQPASVPQVGSAVPAFRLVALDGSQLSLRSWQGQVVVVNFFASWCAPCREEASDLEQTWREYQGRGVQFFGIAYKDVDSKAQAFLDEFSVTYPCALDPGSRTARAYGVTGVPETYVVDQQGQLVRHFIGPVTKAQLGHEISQALGP